MNDQQFEELCETYGFAPSRDLKAMLNAALMWKREQYVKRVSPKEFADMVRDKEAVVGAPVYWAQWPTEESNANP